MAPFYSLTLAPFLTLITNPRRWRAAQRLAELLNEQRHEQFPQAVEIRDADAILKPRQRWLTGEVLLGIAGVAAGNHLDPHFPDDFPRLGMRFAPHT